ncbi:(2Fe-2S) ferredoxin domain-containing protein [Magnetococcales bacterium HHB-1]
MKPEKHVFVCMNNRPPGHPKGSCQSVGAAPVMEAFYAEMEKRGLWGKVLVTGAGCMGPCDQGPTVVVYPEGVWYGRVKAENVSAILDSFDSGEVVKDLQIA